MIADAYGRYSQQYASIIEPFLEPMAKDLVALTALRRSEQVLDLPTGTGLIARAVSETMTRYLVGRDARFLDLVRRLPASTAGM